VMGALRSPRVGPLPGAPINAAVEPTLTEWLGISRANSPTVRYAADDVAAWSAAEQWGWLGARASLSPRPASPKCVNRPRVQ
jgi:hypothetical protein